MRFQIAAGVPGLGPRGQPEDAVAPQVPKRANPRVALVVDRREMAEPRLGQEGIDLFRGHRHAYFTTVCSTNSSPNALVKLARSSVERFATSLAMSALKSSRDSHVSSAIPSYGASWPSGTLVTAFTTYPVRCS